MSVIIALYNVENYVKSTLRSLDRQSSGLDDVEVIIVNDGSTDRSLEVVEEWAKGRSNVVIRSQENGGAGSARALGLSLATGEWLTVVDPDDLVDRDYIASIFEFIDIDKSGRADLLITRVMMLNDSTGRIHDNHPLKYRFSRGTRLVSLLDEPDMIQLGATCVLRTSRLKEAGITYDTRIEPTFEDAHVIGRYLALREDPVVGVVPRAKYYYRKRVDQSSLVQSSWAKPSRYTTVLRRGYLSLLKSVTNDQGDVPLWTQNMVLYDIFWYFKEDSKQHSRTGWVSGELAADFVLSLREIFEYIDTVSIRRFWINPIWWTLRSVVITYFKSHQGTPNEVYYWGKDQITGNRQYCILYPSYDAYLEIFIDGVPVTPETDDFTIHRYFDTDMMTERNFSIRGDGDVRILVDHSRRTITRPATKVRPPIEKADRFPLQWDASSPRSGNRTNPNPMVAGSSIGTRLGRLRKKLIFLRNRVEVQSLALNESRIRSFTSNCFAASKKMVRARKYSAQQRKASYLIDLAGSLAVQSKYRNAWSVMDRPESADDNAEHLYRHLLRNRPDINAFFLLAKQSKDWPRLEKEGFRLVEYGSDESVLLLMNCVVRVSSDAVAACMYPVPRKFYDFSTSKFVFLQHGVTMNDLSRWLNPKKIDAVVCATNAERNSFVGRRSTYNFKESQALLTGFPRFDGLHDLARAQSSEERDLIVVMPTWRQYLRDDLASATNAKERNEIVASSEFARNWMDFLSSQRLRVLAQESGSSIAFLGHPAFKEVVNEINLPDHVKILDPTIVGFQNIISKAKIFVTDYSSISFDAATLGIPSVYYQFDYDQVYGGSHNFRKGYFDFVEDGFGPVATSATDVLAALDELLQNVSSASMHKYQARMSGTFEFQDGENSARVASRIEDLLPRKK